MQDGQERRFERSSVSIDMPVRVGILRYTVLGAATVAITEVLSLFCWINATAIALAGVSSSLRCC